MKKHSYITMAIGFLLLFLCGFIFIQGNGTASPSGLIGLALIYLGWKGGRKAQIIFGHSLIIVGAYLITWGLYLLPVSDPNFLRIILKPLFWGIFCLFGGVCSIYHGFCACVNKSQSQRTQQ